MKIVTIVGARPQFVKAGVVSRALRSAPGIQEIIIHTGQHYDENMSRVFFDELDIPRPDYDLGIGSGNHGAQTGRMLEAIEAVLVENRPDWTLVFGDTNTTLAGSIASVKLHIPVAHVEAGLRSFNRRMPEEINRVLTDHASDMLFAPTKTAVENLRRDGIADTRVALVGDVMYDAALYYGDKAQRTSRILEHLSLPPGGYVLVTIHRAENTDDAGRFRIICEALIETSRSMPVVFPVHPRTRNVLSNTELGDKLARAISLIDPVGYLDMVMLEKHARVIATDSGGVQKEAFFHRLPCVTLRDETEWVELVDMGWNRLASPGRADIKEAICQASPPASEISSPYGSGHAAEAIRDALLKPSLMLLTSGSPASEVLP